jgi:hypothetical protein
VTSAHPYWSVTSVHTPFSLCARTPTTSLSPLAIFQPEPTLRPAYLQGLVLDLRPTNEQVVSALGLLLRPGFGWYLEILYSKLCNIFCIKVFICYLVFCFIYIWVTDILRLWRLQPSAWMWLFQGAYFEGDCEVSSSLRVCDVSSSPFLPMRAHPYHLPFPPHPLATPNRPYDRPVWKALPWISGHQTNRLFLLSASSWGQVSDDT